MHLHSFNLESSVLSSVFSSSKSVSTLQGRHRRSAQQHTSQLLSEPPVEVGVGLTPLLFKYWKPREQRNHLTSAARGIDFRRQNLRSVDVRF